MPHADVTTLVDLLAARARDDPRRAAFTFDGRAATGSAAWKRAWTISSASP
jgi:hypothetical protein